VSAALDAADGQPSDQGFSPDVAVAVDSAAVKVRQKKKKRRRKRRKKRRPKGDDELDNLMNDGP
jgi:CelD/BcsL family acetyltransferase involved in cellulose biosynthesis